MKARACICFLIGCLTLSNVAASQAGAPTASEEKLPAELKPLVDEFFAVSDGDTDAALSLFQAMAGEEFEQAQWEEVFRAVLAEVPYTSNHTSFWDQLVTQTEGRLQVKMATYAALFSVEAIAQSSVTGGAQTQIFQHINLPAAFLMYLADGFTEDRKGDVFNALWERLGDTGASAMAGALRSALTPANYAEYIQIALTLAEYMPPGPAGYRRVGEMLGQPDPLKQFWIGNAIFLFDEGGLTQAHIASLESLVRAVPRQLHAVGAIIFPESTGINPDTQAFTTSVQILYLPIEPIGNMTDPGEFLVHVGQPVAPAFTIGAAEQLVYAIQEVQFAANPSLVQRRDSILEHAKGNFEAYMRRDFIVPVETYLENPDSFLPSVAVLWFIDSVRTMAIAKDLFQLSMNPGMDSVLLLTDMLSGGTNTAPTFRTELNGRVHAGACQIARTHVTRVRRPRADRFNQGGPWESVDLYLPSGIQIGPYFYEFELNDYGGTKALHPLYHPNR